MLEIKDILKNKSLKKDFRNSYEYQAYGNRLAEEFGDIKHRALYIKLAKNEDRNLLEAARLFVMGSENTTTKGRLFMWKLTQIKNEKKNKDNKNTIIEQEENNKLI